MVSPDEHLENAQEKKKLVYSCIFGNNARRGDRREVTSSNKYLELLSLLLKSYVIYGVPSNNIEYLVICNLSVKSEVEKLFETFNINGKTWCLEPQTLIEQYSLRLKIFEYPNINKYSKLLYLDTDILLTGKIDKILDFELDNKLYALQEGLTNDKGSDNWWGKSFFEQFSEQNPNVSGFNSGILLFNNHIKIDRLFSSINQHIKEHIENKLPILPFLDQPFIVYHAVKNDMYNNTSLYRPLIEVNPCSLNHETIICHFPGGPGDYSSKIVKMQNYMNNIMLKDN
tara:strand:+ start:619 stop:1473 length:855 start_codon:yes stop_codon:yes gene_type:complete